MKAGFPAVIDRRYSGSTRNLQPAVRLPLDYFLRGQELALFGLIGALVVEKICKILHEFPLQEVTAAEDNLGLFHQSFRKCEVYDTTENRRPCLHPRTCPVRLLRLNWPNPGGTAKRIIWTWHSEMQGGLQRKNTPGLEPSPGSRSQGKGRRNSSSLIESIFELS
jgi:hypothetical protein